MKPCWSFWLKRWVLCQKGWMGSLQPAQDLFIAIIVPVIDEPTCCFCLITCICKYQRNSTSLKISDMNGQIEREVIATKASLASHPMAWQLVTFRICPKRYAFLVRNRQDRQVIQKIKFIKKSPEPMRLHTIPELNRGQGIQAHVHQRH